MRQAAVHVAEEPAALLLQQSQVSPLWMRRYSFGVSIHEHHDAVLQQVACTSSRDDDMDM